jgi:hypothetical protein
MTQTGQRSEIGTGTIQRSSIGLTPWSLDL